MGISDGIPWTTMGTAKSLGVVVECMCMYVCIYVQPFSNMMLKEVCVGKACRILVAENNDKHHHFIVSCDASNSYNITSTRARGLQGLNVADSIPPKHR